MIKVIKEIWIVCFKIALSRSSTHISDGWNVWQSKDNIPPLPQPSHPPPQKKKLKILQKNCANALPSHGWLSRAMVDCLGFYIHQNWVSRVSSFYHAISVARIWREYLSRNSTLLLMTIRPLINIERRTQRTWQAQTKVPYVSTFTILTTFLCTIIEWTKKVHCLFV